MTHALVQQLHFARSEFQRALVGVTDAEAARRFLPMNCVSWNVGHLAWHEQRYWLSRLSGITPVPIVDEIAAYGRPASTPSLRAMRRAWNHVVAAADSPLDALTEADMTVSLPGSPTRLIGNAILRVTYHYWFHIGEIVALRQLPVEHIVEEIRRYPSRHFFFVDDNIFLSHKYAYELFEALIPLKIQWGSQASLELICKDEALLKLAARSGCMSLFVGFESIDQEILNKAHKSFNKVDRFDANIAKMHKYGINVAGAFIFGFEGDTYQTFQNTLDFAMRNHLAMLNCGIMTPFPGTEVFQKIEREGRLTDQLGALHGWQPGLVPPDAGKGRAGARLPGVP